MRNLMKSLTAAVLLLGAAASGQQTYTIKPGDNLTKIARKHGCSVEALVRANKLKPDALIRPGQNLIIPANQTSPPATANTPSTGAGTPASHGKTHTIKEGETFSSIARRHKIPVEQLLKANPDADPRTLRPGRVIQLGVPSAPAVAAVTADPPAPKQPEQSKQPEPEQSKEPEPEILTPPAQPPSSKISIVRIENNITYGDFAAKYGTDISRLNELNGLDLDSDALLVQESELYVPTNLPPNEDPP
jgi:LysM repeat protein